MVRRAVCKLWFEGWKGKGGDPCVNQQAGLDASTAIARKDSTAKTSHTTADPSPHLALN